MSNEFNNSFEFELSDESVENLKKIIALEKTNEITLGIDYGSGKIIQVTGNLVNINFEYKRKKKGKKYKLFKTINPPYLIMQFISKDLEVCNE